MIELFHFLKDKDNRKREEQKKKREKETNKYFKETRMQIAWETDLFISQKLHIFASNTKKKMVKKRLILF